MWKISNINKTNNCKSISCQQISTQWTWKGKFASSKWATIFSTINRDSIIVNRVHGNLFFFDLCHSIFNNRKITFRIFIFVCKINVLFERHAFITTWFTRPYQKATRKCSGSIMSKTLSWSTDEFTSTSFWIEIFYVILFTGWSGSALPLLNFSTC